MFIFPVQLTTSRIGNLSRLIHTLLYVMTIHTYIHVHLSLVRTGVFFMETYVLEYTMATRNVTIVLGSPIMVVEPQVTITSFKHNFSS